jgi:hypothetical protein
MEIQIKDISKILIYRLSKNGGVTYQVAIGAVDNEMVYEPMHMYELTPESGK